MKVWEEELEEENDDEYGSEDGVSVDRGQDEANFAVTEIYHQASEIEFITKAGNVFPGYSGTMLSS